ncbi:MAG: NADH-quinone oxidoreductase subunit NuoE [Bacillota bacterium]|nr:NADH-quinone oxidoreductase subunit NuoE [Bacillota bacterium]
MCQCQKDQLTKEDVAKVEAFVASHKNTKGNLIPILHDIQDSFGFVPYDAMRIISDRLDVPISEVYGVVTFYSRFSLRPTGKYKVSVCLGTACYVKGSDLVLERLKDKLRIKAGETTADGKFSIEATRCIGACGLAPAVTVNDEVFSKVQPEDVDEILAKFQ